MTSKKLDKFSSVLRVLNNEVDEFVRGCCDKATRNGHTIQCKSGCAGCCYMLVTSSMVEAIELVRCAMSNGREDALRGKFDQIAEDLKAVMTRGMTTEIWLDERRLCAFLDEDARCIAYESRPQVCRAYCVVSDPHLCFARSDTIIRAVDARGQYERFWSEFDRVAVGFGIPAVHAPLPYLLPLAMRWVGGGENDVIRILKRAGTDDQVAWVLRWAGLEQGGLK